MDVLIAGNMKSIPPNTPDSQIFVVQKNGKEYCAIANESIIDEFKNIPNEHFILPLAELIKYMDISKLTYEIIGSGVKL